MKKFYVVIAAICLLPALACKKIAYAPPPVATAGGIDSNLVNPPGSRLVKTITESYPNYDNDTATTSAAYMYDNSGRLTSLIEFGILSCGTIDSFYRQFWQRDGAGRVKRLLSITENSPAFDTSFIDYYYVNNSSWQVAYEKPGGTDSNAYIRNTAGQVVAINYYHLTKGGMVFGGHSQYSYTGSNVTQIIVYGFTDTTGFQPGEVASTYTYQYDNHINCLYTGDDIIPQLFLVNPYKMLNNPTICTQALNNGYFGGPYVANDQRAYTYRADGRPASCQRITFVGPGVYSTQQYKTTYFYN